MGPKSGCNQTYVEIIETDSNIAPTRFCGTDDPAPYKARSNQLYISDFFKLQNFSLSIIPNMYP